MSRRLVVLVMVFSAFSVPLRAQNTPQTQVRVDVMKRMIQVVAAYTAPTCSIADHRKSVDASHVCGLLWEENVANGWCEYHKLSPREVNEMFTLRFRNYPELRREAERILKRDVGKDGFGFRLPGEWTSAEGWGPEHEKEAGRVFATRLQKFGLTRCE